MTGKPRPPGPISVAVGQNLRAVRERKKLTQGELGDLIGASQSAIMNMERARTQMSVETLILLAGALGVSPARLLRDVT